jgi:hypothetical protein
MSMTSFRQRVIVLGIPRDARCSTVEDVILAQCSNRIQRIEMREGFAFVDLDLATDVAKCLGRYNILGKIVVVLPSSDAIEHEVATTGRVPAALAH